VKKLLLIPLMIILLVGLVLVGCGKSTTPAPAPTKELKIGSVQILNMPMGLEQQKWLKLFAKLINDKGGWKIGNDTYKIEMIIYDSQNDTALAKNYLEKLVYQDGVKYILGSPTGNPATDTLVTEPNKVICLGLDLTGTSADPKIQYYWTPNGMYFSGGMLWVVYSDIAAAGAKSYVSVKLDNLMGHVTDSMDNASWKVAAPDVEYLGTVFFDPATTDFGPIATKIKSMNPDVLDCNYTISTPLMNALYDVGFKGLILPAQVDPPMFDAILSHCGKEFMEGWEFFLQDPRLYPDQPKEIMDLLDAYEKEYGEFQTGGCLWVAYWFIFKDAVENTQSLDVDVLKNYLDHSDHAVRTLTGLCQLFPRPDAKNLRTISGEPADFVGVIHDGQIVPLRAVTIKDHVLGAILAKGKGVVDAYKAYWEEYGYFKFPAEQQSIIKYSDLGIMGKD
jgi:ABC-type branched-subunit amino acid transport system substrate-binding protein